MLFDIGHMTHPIWPAVSVHAAEGGKVIIIWNILSSFRVSETKTEADSLK